MLKHLTLATALFITPIAAQAVDLNGGTEAQYAAVQKFHDDTVARFNAGDLEGSVNDYLERLVVAHTKRMELTGRDGLEESWGKAFASSTKPYLVSEIIAMEVNGDDIGDWSYIICDYASVGVDKESGKQVGEPSNGRYIALLEMTADGWKVLLDIDNGAAGAAPHLEEQLLKQLNL
ncbi:MAG: hypothetical protein RIC29_16425 [Rhodospirillaceae bacterium]